MIEAKKTKVLVIDDNEQIRNLVNRILSDKKYSVTGAASAEEGRRILKKSTFGVIILDIELPGTDGLSMLKEIRKSGKEDAQIIMATGRGTVEYAVRAMKSGAYDFVTKPFEIDKFRTIVRRAAEKSALESELDIMQTIYKVSKDLGSVKKLDDMLREIMDIAIKVSAAAGGSMGIYNEESGELKIELSKGTRADLSRGDIIKKGDKVCGWVVQHRQPVILNIPAEEDGRFKNIDIKNNVSSGICVPMLMRDKVIGTLNLVKEDNKFSYKDLRIVTVFAQYAALTIQNSRDYTQLLELDNLKDDFLTNVSHELRTPLQSITNACEILEEKYPAEKLIELLKRNSKRMSNLVIDLLDISKIEKGWAVNFQPFSVKEFLKEIIEILSPAAEEKDINIDYRISGDINKVSADKELIKRVLLNIVNNAVKYCPRNSKVEIEVSKGRGGTEFSVSDNGPGIPKDEQEHIFERFYQQRPGRSLTQKHSGIGLGLAMVKDIIERHGGKVEVESRCGGGSRFRFVLPDNTGGRNE